MHTEPTAIAAPLSSGKGFPTLSRRLQIVYASSLPWREKHVLAYIAYRVDKETGTAFMGVKRMIAESGLPRSTLHVRLNNLVRLGWIRRIQRWDATCITSLVPEKFQSRRESNTGPATALPGCENGPSPVSGTGTPRANGGPLSVSPSVDSSGEKKSVSDTANPEDQIDFQKLFLKIRKSTPDLTRKQFDWMVSRIRGRAKLPPKSEAFYVTSINAFLAVFDVELTQFLFTIAQILLRDANPDGEVRERLKCVCAENELPVSPDLIAAAVDRAYRTP